MYKSRDINNTIHLSVWYSIHITDALPDYENFKE